MKVFNLRAHKGVEILGIHVCLRRRVGWGVNLRRTSNDAVTSRSLDAPALRTLRVLAAAAVVSGGGSVVFSIFASRASTFAGDAEGLARLQSWGGAPARHLFEIISAATGGWQFALLALALGAALFMFGKRLEALFVVGSGASGIVSALVKVLVDRPRPQLDSLPPLATIPGSSFPSNHVVVYTVFGGFILWLLAESELPKLLKLLGGALVTGLVGLVDVSRVYEGAHWPSDVYGGSIVGIFLLCLLLLAYIYIGRTAIYESGRH